MTDNMFDRVRAVLADHFGKNAGDLLRHTRLSDLGADSLDRVELEMAFSEQMNVEVDLSNTETVGDVLTAVQSA